MTNFFGYSIDGNSDGEGGDNYVVNYTTSMFADFNNDNAINEQDLSQFVINWDNGNYDRELGPFYGEIPNVFVDEDQIYNIEDLVGFAMMWNWYNSVNTLTFINYEDGGNPINIDAKHDSIYFDIPANLSAFKIQISYQPESLTIKNNKPKQDEIYLDHKENEIGFTPWIAQPKEEKLVLPIKFESKEINISISYIGLDENSKLSGQMTKSIKIENIPDEFILYNNYPNPFNPTTKIEYGLSDAANVRLRIYDILGREIILLVNKKEDAGYKSVTWNGFDKSGRDMGAGMYFYVLEADNFRQVKRKLK